MSFIHSHFYSTTPPDFKKIQEYRIRSSRFNLISCLKKIKQLTIQTIQKIWRYMASHLGHVTRCEKADHELRQKHLEIFDQHCPDNIRNLKTRYSKANARNKKVAYGFAVPGAAASGAGFGAAIGSIGGPVGAGIGAGIGAAVGGISSALLVKKTLHCHYQLWLEKNLNRNYKEALIDFHKGHNEMAPFCCPLTSSFLIDPVVTPFGDTYERSAIEAFINLKQRALDQNPRLDPSITDPNGKGHFRVADLKKDYVTILKMHKAYCDLVEYGIALEQVDSPVKLGLLALKADLDLEIKHMTRKIAESKTKKHIDLILKQPDGVNMFLDEVQEMDVLVANIAQYGHKTAKNKVVAALGGA